MLLLLPLWTVHRVPSTDGPCHLYNAWVMHHLHDPAYPAIGSHFRLALAPVPNWLSPVLLYLLLSVVPPLLAEKLLFSFYVVLFGAIAWWFAGLLDPTRRVHAFLALPFTYNFMVRLGFLNFMLSVPLMLLAVGAWWRGREAPGARFALRLNLLLVLCYFAHLVGLVVALVAIGLLWLASFDSARWRRWLLHPLLLLPQVPLPLWFLTTHPSAPAANRWPWALRFGYLRELRALFLYPHRYRVGYALVLLFALLAVVTLVLEGRRAPRAHHGFVAAAFTVLTLYLLAPWGIGEGGILPPRLSILPFLLVLPWLTSRLARPLQLAIPAALLLLVAWESASLVDANRHAAAEVDAFLAGLAQVPAGSRVATLIWNRDRGSLGHGAAYAAISRGLVDWGDYQAGIDLFPVRWRSGIVPPQGLEAHPERYPPRRWAPVVDYVYTWAMPAGAAVRPRLRYWYRPAGRVGAGQLWQRRSDWNLRGGHP